MSLGKMNIIKNRNRLQRELNYSVVKFMNTYNKLSRTEKELPYQKMKSVFLSNRKTSSTKSKSKKRSVKRASKKRSVKRASKKRSVKRASKKRSTKRKSVRSKNTPSKNRRSPKPLKHDRPSPAVSATEYAVGTVKKGNDGNKYVVIRTSNGNKRWVKSKV